MYRRYGREGARWTRRKPFYEKFPSLSCLFRSPPQAGDWGGHEAGRPQQQQQQLLAALPRNTMVSREDVVAALVRLRGNANANAGVGRKGGRGKLLPACGANVRRRRILLRAVRKVAHCCQVAGVRTAPQLAKTLRFFDFSPADDDRYKVGRMRMVDMWHWLRLLSVPTDPSGGDRRPVEVSSFNKNRTAMASSRLLNAKETSLILDAVECRPVVGEEFGQDSVCSLPTKRETLGAGFFVSVPALWDLLVKYFPGLWDKGLDSTEGDEVR